MESHSAQLFLNFGFTFEDLHRPEDLARLDDVFLDRLKVSDPALHGRLIAARENPSALARKDESELIIEVAPHLEDFIGHLFGITPEIEELQARHNRLAPLYSVKRNFVQRKAVPKIPKDQAAALDGNGIRVELERIFGEPLTGSGRDVASLAGRPRNVAGVLPQIRRDKSCAPITRSV